jgi:hypothetical protein
LCEYKQYKTESDEREKGANREAYESENTVLFNQIVNIKK